MATSALQRAVRRLGRERRRGTISLAGLDPQVKALVSLVIAGVALTTGFLVLNLVFGFWPQPVVRVPGMLLGEPRPGRLSVVPFVIASAAMAIALGAFGASFGAAPGLRRRIGLAVIGLIGAEIGVAMLGVADMTAIAFPDAQNAPRACGLVAIVAGVGLAVLPARIARRPAVTALLAATPVLAGLVSLALLSARAADIGIAATDPKWPARVEGVALAAGALANLIFLVSSLVGVLFVWQSVTAARAVRRQLGVTAGALTDRRPGILAALLGAKVVWLVAGYAGLLPALLMGTSADSWLVARDEDLPGFMVAAAIVAAITAWLLRGGRPIVPDGGIGWATAGLVVGFNALAMLASAAILIASLDPTAAPQPGLYPPNPSLPDCLPVVGSGAPTAGLCMASAFSGLIEYGPITTWVAAIVIGALLWGRRRWRPVAVALLVIAAWMTPTALGVLRGLVEGREPASIGRPELITIDAMLTAVVAGLAILWWTGRQRAVGPGALAIVLVTATLVAHVGALVPAGYDGLVIGLVFLLGGLYSLTFESAELNQSGRARPERVPRAIGLLLLNLGLVVFAIAFDQFNGGGADLAVLFVPPVVVLLVGAELSHDHRVRVGTRAGRPAATRGLAAAAAGALVVGALLAATSFVAIGPPPEPVAARYGEFVEHADRGSADLVTTFTDLVTNQDRSSEARFIASVDAEAAWTAGRVADACFRDEFGRWQAVVNGFVALRDSYLTGIGDLQTAYAGAVMAYRNLDLGGSACQTVVPGLAGPSPSAAAP